MRSPAFHRSAYAVLARISPGYPPLHGQIPTYSSPVRHSPPGVAPRAAVRLACVRHAASVRSEPESNSQVCDQSHSQAGIDLTTRPDFKEPFLHNLTWCVRRTYRTACFTEYPTPRKRQTPRPPPTCPFINPTMRKNRRSIAPDLVVRDDRVTDLGRGATATRKVPRHRRRWRGIYAWHPMSSTVFVPGSKNSRKFL